MKIEVKNNCPLNKFDPCKELDCAWFCRIRGTNPNTGEETDEYACAIAWMPVLMIENASVTRGTGAAVESFRNEMVKANESAQKLMTATIMDNKKIKLIQNED